MATEAEDWQTKREEVRERLAHLLDTSLWSDCSFTVGSEAEVVKAHKFVLAMASPVFETMFSSSWAAGNAPIPVPDITPDAFKDMLNYIYTDKLALASCMTACELYYAARKYMFPRVSQQCICYIERNLSPQNVCYAYEMAKVFDEENLMKLCLKTIRAQTKQVLDDPSILEADIGTLEVIFSQDQLTIDSELELFGAVKQWARARGVRGLKRGRSHAEGGSAKRPKTEHSQDTSTASIAEEVSTSHPPLTDSEALRSALSKIRYLTLTVHQFAAGPAKSGLLPVADALPLLLKIAGATVPLPEGFSQSKLPRQNEVCPLSSQARSEIEVEMRVYNFKTRKRTVVSEPFHCRGLTWRFKVVPGDGYGLGRSLGVCLECEGDRTKDWQCNATVTIEVVAKYSRLPPKKETHKWTFNSVSNRHTNEAFAWFEDVVNGKWLLSNTLTFLVRLQVAPAGSPPDSF